MQKAHMMLDKDFGVLVHRAGKTVLKQFDTKKEVDAFCEKLSTFDEVDYDIIQRRLRGEAGRPYSPAFVAVKAPNVPGGITYKCIPVRYAPGKLFCTDCHAHTRFVKKEFEYGLELTVCEFCDTPDTDFYVKTANDLWEKMPRAASSN